MDSPSMHPARPGQKPRILCVDDEPHVLEGLRDSLRRSFDVQVADSGPAGLALLSADRDGYAVVISDMRMPGMTGAQFLREAKRVAPQAVRMLLTGYADTESAMRAVNDGQIFRYLTKPCEREELSRACAAGVWQHRVLAAERVLLEQTLRGSVQALTDVLALASPAAFGRGTRLRHLLSRLAADVGVEDSWEVEVAASLAFVGAVTLPEEIAEKLNAGVLLSASEEAMAANVPAATERILANIPRLGGVQQILARYQSNFDSGPLPAGARMLRIAVDYDRLHAEGLSELDAVGTLRGREGVYDPELLDAFARVVGAAAGAARVRELQLAELEVGMTLADDVREPQGRLLISRGYVVTQELRERLRNFPPEHVRSIVRVVAPEAEPAA